jgi:uncharacterized protein YdeI (YjbR/CyaY-like superfamily)
MSAEPKFFKSAAAFRAWLEGHHGTRRELVIGFHKRGLRRPGMTYPEAVDEALAFGWIDGVLRRMDDERYCIRFTPRRPGSVWSAVNIRKAKALVKAGRMAAAGLTAFRAGKRANTKRYSYENRPQALPAKYARAFKRNTRAWTFFKAQPPGYRRMATWFVVSAVKEETRDKRLARLIEVSAAGKRLEPMVPLQRQ